MGLCTIFILHSCKNDCRVENKWSRLHFRPHMGWRLSATWTQQKSGEIFSNKSIMAKKYHENWTRSGLGIELITFHTWAVRWVKCFPVFQMSFFWKKLEHTSVCTERSEIKHCFEVSRFVLQYCLQLFCCFGMVLISKWCIVKMCISCYCWIHFSIIWPCTDPNDYSSLNDLVHQLTSTSTMELLNTWFWLADRCIHV